MSCHFWRRLRVAPVPSLDLSQRGTSSSTGSRSTKTGGRPSGRRRTTQLPGTGLFYTRKLASQSHRRQPGSAAVPRKPAAALKPGSAEHLGLRAEEAELLNGCRELSLGNDERALSELGQTAHLADAAFLAAGVALRLGRVEEAERYLGKAEAAAGQLGRALERLGLEAYLDLEISPEVGVRIPPTRTGLMLMRVEIYQRTNQLALAADILDALRRRSPDDVALRLSLAELLLESEPKGRPTARRVLRLTDRIQNESPLHSALLLHRVRALRRLGLLIAARDLSSQTLRRSKDRPRPLLLALRYERAAVYEALGQERRARADWERIHAVDPDYSDIAERLSG